MTAQEIIDNARTDMAIDPGKEIWTDSQLLRYLNEATSFLYAKANWKYEFEDGTVALLVLNQANYALPADFRRMLWVKVVDGTKPVTSNEAVIPMVTNTLSDFQQTRDMDATGDGPGFTYIEDGDLYVWPLPNATAVATYSLKFKYVKYPAELTGVDTPIFPAEWHFILGHYIRYRAFASKPGGSNKAFAQDALNEWELWSKKAIADMLHLQDERLSYIMPTLPSNNAK